MPVRIPLLLLVGALLLAPGARAQFASVTVTTIADLNASGDVEVGPDGLVYVADFGAFLSGGTPGTTVYRVTLEGAVSPFATGLVGASGNAFDAEGNLIQSNIAAGTLSKITPQGVVTTFASDGIAAPVGVAIDADGNVYNTNCVAGPGYITKTTPNGATTTVFATSSLMSCPNGLTIDDDGVLYTANFNDGRVLKITPSGVVTQLAFLSAAPIGNGHLTYANGRLYVCNWGGRIYEVTLDGQSRVLAGTGAPGNADGPGDAATFFRPNGIAATVTGDTLYINQTSEIVPLPQIHPNNVRRITNVLTTVAAEPGPEQPTTGVTLHPIVPNPFTSSTRLRFTLPAPSRVSLAVFDVWGRCVAQVMDGESWGAGHHSVPFNGAGLASGMYLYRLGVTNADGTTYHTAARMTLMR